MAILYNKLGKLRIDKKIDKVDLRKAAGIVPNTMTRLGRNEEVTLTVLNKSCENLNIGMGYIKEPCQIKFPNGLRGVCRCPN